MVPFLPNTSILTVIFVVSSPTDPDHIYDFPSEVENDQKVTKHTTARQGEDFDERYQGREENGREKRHGCLDTDVLPRAPSDHQQRQQSLNPAPAGIGTIVGTGRL